MRCHVCDVRLEPDEVRMLPDGTWDCCNKCLVETFDINPNDLDTLDQYFSNFDDAMKEKEVEKFDDDDVQL